MVFQMSLGRLGVMLAWCMLIIVSHIQPAFALETGEDLERQVKSAFIFKFGNYVTWPEKSFAEATSPIIIGIVNDELMATEIEKIAAGYTAGNRPVVVKRLNLHPADAASAVHIMYLNDASTKYIDVYQKALLQPPTLYITDTVEGLNSGGVINFVRDDSRVRFDVSMPAAAQNNLKLDSSLLTVARHVLMQ